MYIYMVYCLTMTNLEMETICEFKQNLESTEKNKMLNLLIYTTLDDSNASPLPHSGFVHPQHTYSLSMAATITFQHETL